jgi:hypothetical protein
VNSNWVLKSQLVNALHVRSEVLVYVAASYSQSSLQLEIALHTGWSLSL